MEIRVDVTGREGKYQVSNVGRIRSLPNVKRKGIRILKPGGNGRYKIVIFSMNGEYTGKLVHRLVAQAFIPNPDNKKTVNHKNGDRIDNIAENLERCTQSENSLHSIYVLGKKNTNGMTFRKGKLNHSSKKVAQYSMTGELIRTRDCMVDAMNQLGIYSGNIGMCCNGKRTSAGGYIWSFSNNN